MTSELVPSAAVGAEAAFDDDDLPERLAPMTDADLDRLGFGVIAFDADDLVVAYNSFEAQRAGISAERVLGRDVFVEVAPCTNNYLVAQRYADEPDLDEYLDYVFTLRMRPTPVRLRLVARPGATRRYMLVQPA